MNLPTFDELLGDHQHGFRAGRSTTTCLLNLKDTICELLDSKTGVIAYSLDLSAAFDMLRPDTFKDLMKGKIPDDLLGILGEFLCDRKFYVEINGKKSNVKSIDRGCPQGSVLGPVLFNLYTGIIARKIPPDAVLTSYADDSYVVLQDKNQESLAMKAEGCLSAHIEALEEIGMKVNEEKTEIVLFGKKPQNITLNVKGTAVESKEAIKALGIVIDKGLTWNHHVTALKKRVVKIIGGIRVIRKKLTKREAITVVTAQVFSLLYYACCVWLTPAINKKTLKTVESLHFKTLRLVLKDYKNRISRENVSLETQRLPPDKWSKFALASLFINCYNFDQYSSLVRRLSCNFYSKRRKPGFLYAYDSAKTKMGKQVTKNWIGNALSCLVFPWSDRSLSKDAIRIALKKSYSDSE